MHTLTPLSFTLTLSLSILLLPACLTDLGSVVCDEESCESTGSLAYSPFDQPLLPFDDLFDPWGELNAAQESITLLLENPMVVTIGSFSTLVSAYDQTFLSVADRAPQASFEDRQIFVQNQFRYSGNRDAQFSRYRYVMDHYVLQLTEEERRNSAVFERLLTGFMAGRPGPIWSGELRKLIDSIIEDPS